MKKNVIRFFSLLLVLAMVLSVIAPLSWAAEVQEEQQAESSMSDSPAESSPEEEKPAEEEETPTEPEPAEEPEEPQEGESSEEPGDDSEVQAEEEQEGESQEEGEPQGEPEVDPADQEDGSGDESTDESIIEEPTEQASIKVAQTYDLKLEYDDRYTFTKLKKGYSVVQITGDPTSFAVEKGAVTTSRDKAVLTLDTGSTVKVRATGVGSATVLLVSDRKAAAAAELLAAEEQNKEDEVPETDEQGGEAPLPSSGVHAAGVIEAVQVNVTVVPAKLTIMFLAGQSNMEGFGSYPGSGKKAISHYQFPQDSIVCQEGEVYSTYAPSDTTRMNTIGGVKFSGYCAAKDAPKFVAGSLTGTKSVSGTALTYPLNQMTAAGKGKTGPDSGLAYEWNRLTGDKVWAVNAAWGGSGSNRWVPGKDCYDRAAAVFKNALKTYNAEIKAGHYKQSRKLYFWLQGEADGQSSVKVATYYNNFKKMHDGMKKICGFSHMGIISVRASLGGFYKDARDLKMTAPRIVQTYLANTDSFSDIHIVSDVNEQWVTDSGVEKYFSGAYGSALSYPTHGKTPSLPTKVSQVHNDIHFLQVGHNENGLTAARGMYQVVTGGKADKYSVTWRNKNAKVITKLTMKVGKSAFVSPAVNPVWASKPAKWRFASGLSYAGKTATLTAQGYGTKKAEGLDPSGRVIGTLTVTVKPLSTPVLTSAANGIKGVTILWKKVSGAEAYQVFRHVEGETKWSKLAKTTGVAYTDTTAKNGVTYFYTVRCVTKDGKFYTSEYDNTGKRVLCLSAPTLSSVKNEKKRKLTAKWSKNQEAEGYQVQYSLNANFNSATTKTFNGANKLSATITGLKKKKVYYVRVRAWRTAAGGKVYSAWSTASKVKISK